jgi:hypothetical protein
MSHFLKFHELWYNTGWNWSGSFYMFYGNINSSIDILSMPWPVRVSAMKVSRGRACWYINSRRIQYWNLYQDQVEIPIPVQYLYSDITTRYFFSYKTSGMLSVRRKKMWKMVFVLSKENVSVVCTLKEYWYSYTQNIDQRTNQKYKLILLL